MLPVIALDTRHDGHPRLHIGAGNDLRTVTFAADTLPVHPRHASDAIAARGTNDI